jgi:hypothetical protein
MKKSGDDVPEWMLNLKSKDNKSWKKLEKAPIYRKNIITKVKEHAPKRFLKQMEKNMRRSGAFNHKEEEAGEWDE